VMPETRSMETDLHSLKIDRSARREPESHPARRWILVSLIVVVLAGGAAFSYRAVTAPLEVTSVHVAAPSATSEGGGHQTILSATGYIVAAHTIEVASKVNGRVLWIGVEKADKVKAGQVLVRLEDVEYRAQLQQATGQLQNLEARLAELVNGSRPEEIARAKADVEQAKADLENAKVTLDRTAALTKEGVMARQSLDDAQAKYDSAAAKVNSLQRTLDLLVVGTRKEQIDQVRGQIEQARGAVAYDQTQLDDTVIKSPVNGTILERNVEKGEFVTTGFVGDKGAKGYVVSEADLMDLKVELDINQNDFARLKADQKGVITTDAYPDRKYQGMIDEISPEANRSKATVQVKVKVLNPDDYLRPEMNATVEFYDDRPADTTAASKPVVTVPAAAILNGAVFAIVDGRARKRSVTTGPATSKGVLVESGLIGGEDLVLNPPADLADGQRVAVKGK
jgi:HlyD family secretion protein